MFPGCRHMAPAGGHPKPEWLLASGKYRSDGRERLKVRDTCNICTYNILSSVMVSRMKFKPHSRPRSQSDGWKVQQLRVHWQEHQQLCWRKPGGRCGRRWGNQPAASQLEHHCSSSSSWHSPTHRWLQASVSICIFINLFFLIKNCINLQQEPSLTTLK